MYEFMHNCVFCLLFQQRCIPEFVNAAFNVRMESTNTCGDNGPQEYCIQTGYSNQKTGKSCENICHQGTHSPIYLTDLHEPQRQTWWQSETMFEGIQHPNQVNLTLHLGNAKSSEFNDFSFKEKTLLQFEKKTFALKTLRETFVQWIKMNVLNCIL